MAIDLIRGGRIKNRGVRETKTSNAYLKTLIKLYSFLDRRTASKFNKTVLKRLNQSRLNRYPISISRIVRILGGGKASATVKGTQADSGLVDKAIDAVKGIFKKKSVKKSATVTESTSFNTRIVAIIGTITNDNRLVSVPKGLRICALKFTATARTRINQAGGECLTFDQLAQIAPTGKNVLLLRGPRDREAKRHFGLYPGQKGSHTAPRVRQSGRKWERARGRR